MNYSKTFLIILALLLGCGAEAMAAVFSVDTIYTKHYPYAVNKLIPRPGANYTYGFIFSYDDDSLRGFVEFSDINGDSLRLVHNSQTIYYPPLIFINDTNYIIGNAGGVRGSIYDIQTGKSKLIRSVDDCLIGYLPESNSVVFLVTGDNGGYLDLYSLDSHKVVLTNRYKYHPEHAMDYPASGYTFISPKGTYVCRLADAALRFQPDQWLFYDRLISTSDFTNKAILRDTVTTTKEASNRYHYTIAVFNDQETLLALTNDYANYVDIFDLVQNRMVKRVSFNEDVWTVGMKFDSTGKYLMFALENFQVFLNVETYQVDYITDILTTAKRIPFTNILFSEARKFRLREITAGVYDESNYSCDVIVNSNGISINSTESIDIKSIKIYDANANSIYTKNDIAQTPLDININLSAGAYFVILNINGNNEYHKVIVY